MLQVNNLKVNKVTEALPYLLNLVT